MRAQGREPWCRMERRPVASSAKETFVPLFSTAPLGPAALPSWMKLFWSLSRDQKKALLLL